MILMMMMIVYEVSDGHPSDVWPISSDPIIGQLGIAITDPPWQPKCEKLLN
jgi:hypothetical protein